MYIGNELVILLNATIGVTSRGDYKSPLTLCNELQVSLQCNKMLIVKHV